MSPRPSLHSSCPGSEAVPPKLARSIQPTAEGEASLKQDSLSNGWVFQTEAVGSDLTHIPKDASLSDRKFTLLLSGAHRIAALTAAIAMLSGFMILAPNRAQADDPVKATYVGGRGLRGVPSDPGGTLEDLTPRIGNGEGNARNGTRRFFGRFS